MFGRDVLHFPGFPPAPPFPTNPFFTILELQNPSNDVPELHKIRWSPDLEALKLWKVSSGCQWFVSRSAWPLIPFFSPFPWNSRFLSFNAFRTEFILLWNLDANEGQTVPEHAFVFFFLRRQPSPWPNVSQFPFSKSGYRRVLRS